MDALPITKAQADALMTAIYERPSQPDLLVIAPGNAAMMRAAIQFDGRDRRRIKREMNKAYRAAVKASRLDRLLLQGMVDKHGRG